MKILLFGKNGQIGWELQRSLQCLGEVISLEKNAEQLCGDLTNLKGIAETIFAVKPTLIVNAAAYTAVDRAESETEIADLINHQAPAAMAAAAKSVNAALVHYSSDYVFDGSGDRAWTECDTPSPLSVYGLSKLAGEKAIAEVSGQYLILRTSWVYGRHGNNFVKTMLRLAQERDELTVVADQFGAPTGAELLADLTAHAIRDWQRDHFTDKFSGIYHVTTQGVTNWFEYASFVISEAKQIKPSLAWRAVKVNPIKTVNYLTPAKRPLNSRLCCEKFTKTFHLNLPRWQTGVKRMLDEWLQD